MNGIEAKTRSTAFHDEVSGLTDRFGGYLRCETCGATGELDSAYWTKGWPEHCGYTMHWWTQSQVDAGEVPEIV